MKLVPINALKTAYYTAGTGERDVLLLHGWASSGRMWLRTLWSLRRYYRMWAPDLPGFGDSQAPALDWCSVERYTDHLIALCDTLGIRPYAVIGHSLGGRLALDLARRYPDYTERVITVSPTVTGKLGFSLDLFLLGPLGRALKDVTRHVWPLATATVMSQYWAPRYLGSEAVQRTTADLRRSSWEGAIGSLRAMVRDDYSTHLPAIEHPTLIMCGERDYTVPPSDSRLAARLLPNARLMMLKRVHHQPTDECPDQFVSALHSFLTEEVIAGNGRNGHGEAVS